ncbi:MAG: universal stress protein, partial [Anaerolineales bacterium]|nr:universal stress protein [Anaerolineales bacterium]
RKMARMATRRGINWSFEVSRGDIAAELLEQAKEADLVILGKTGWSESRTMGSTTRLVVTKADTRVLIVQHETRLVPSLRVIFDGSEASLRALRSAAMLAEREIRELSVLRVAEEEERISELRRQAAKLLRERGLRARYRALTEPEADQLAEAAEALDCVLVLPADVEGLADDEMLEFLDELDCPVMVVR